MTLTRRTWLNLSALWLSLAIVLGHALVPLGEPLHSRSGSAFSAFTSDVALGPERGDEAVELRRASADRDGQPSLSGGDAPFLASASASFALASTPPRPTEFRYPALAAQDAPRRYQARAPPRA